MSKDCGEPAPENQDVKPCSICGKPRVRIYTKSHPDGKNQCLFCQEDRKRKNYWANPDKARADARASYAKSREKRLVQKREYTRKNFAEISRKKKLQASKEDKAKRAAYMKAYWSKHREEYRAYSRKRAKTEKAKAYARQTRHIRRAILKSQPSSSRQELLKAEKEPAACFYCQCDGKLTWDHIYPVSKGGSNLLQNLVRACWPCNNRKLNMLPERWEQKCGKVFFTDDQRHHRIRTTESPDPSKSPGIP